MGEIELPVSSALLGARTWTLSPVAIQPNWIWGHLQESVSYGAPCNLLNVTLWLNKNGLLSNGLNMLIKQKRYYCVFIICVCKTPKQNMTNHVIIVYNRTCFILTSGKFVAVRPINIGHLHICIRQQFV